ncbi:MAG: twin arginine-targeting protein translocase TatC [gamma proteobacterium symbiont of Ctena orbiculata]|uniref:Sec-independent protein translocase protein TatC n=1 Tax=Candidatus Thiodiazotropha taylori TaxID=2792791 RepID=A0A944QRN7_9GAMM|nr:twin-arginine translocase subunit TatC [Candidatus Thiodiazotropha taylori]PUB81948.1 MAG: twin-arginine translocase subunit TatC [gamma proteobacterium symbiont of Ctena orbiculata]MBT2987978.1 twin-arginine translocase subunit TatC [Candidatus Thiodiazotropha taylori]MBT2997623.1 twin-arginine translocase subunit TatC [Candidatus Thiodiazotropha taylori]MBT3001956.1 twin-arginine translocase subunit TatC [Candidatus Thiodiazotropha taylori]
MSAEQIPDSTTKEQPLVSHLIELRDRVLRMVLVVLAVFLVLFPFANDLYSAIAGPMRAALPEGSTMISTKPIDPFLIPFKLSLQLAIFIAVPVILYQFWAFVAPGLYRHEKRLVIPLLVSSTLLFYLGMAFAYFVVFPLVFTFLAGTAPDGVEVATDMGSYLDFVMTLFFAFGVAFEVPIATIILVWMGVTTPQKLRHKRPYVIVGAFVIGMFLTPPDVISQTLLALPMWVLFELGLIFSKGFVKKPLQDSDDGSDAALAVSAATEADGQQEMAAEEAVGSDIDPARDDVDPDRFVPMTDDEMEAELDAIEALEQEEGDAEIDRVRIKLEQVQKLRDNGDVDGARELLYQILEEGNPDQRVVARNILAQLDSDD